MIAVRVNNISKKFKLFNSNKKKLLELISMGKIGGHNEFWALQNISFEIPRGTTFGIIGQNGSGKSTLLGILAGIIKPTCGNFEINGKVSSILELGAGFHPEFTGRENIDIYGAVMGFTKEEINEKFKSILDFSELSNFIDQPIRTYSSGMIARLAFSIAINVNSEILMVDEVLSMGDLSFQYNCFRKIREFQGCGKTILYVGHDISIIRNICNLAMLLDKGKIIEIGNPNSVGNRYFAVIKETAKSNYENERLGISNSHQNRSADPPFFKAGLRYGTKEVDILKVKMLDDNDNPKNMFESGEFAKIRIYCKINKDIDQGFNLGITIRNIHFDVYITNAHWLNYDLGKIIKGTIFEMDFIQNLNLGPGIHTISPAASIYCDGHPEYKNLDWANDIYSFSIIPSNNFSGFAFLDTKIDFKKYKPL